MTRTDVPPLDLAADLDLDAGGRGGDWWGDDDSGDEWGWSEDPDDEASYRRPRLVRALALMTAVAVVAGSLGTWVAVLAVGGPDVPYAVTAVRGSPFAGSSVVVRFVVTNESAQSGRAECQATVASASANLGTATQATGEIAAGTSAPMTLRVPLGGLDAWPGGTARIGVRCLPAVSVPR